MTAPFGQVLPSLESIPSCVAVLNLSPISLAFSSQCTIHNSALLCITYVRAKLYLKLDACVLGPSYLSLLYEKVKFTLEQAIKAQWESNGIAQLFL